MRTETRPWGRYWVLYEDETMWLKEICIAPGQSLSLQRHVFRSEHWLHKGDHASPRAAYSVGGIEGVLVPDTIVSVPQWETHRLWNPCNEEVCLLEWAIGLPMESDIERLSDIYGR